MSSPSKIFFSFIVSSYWVVFCRCSQLKDVRIDAYKNRFAYPLQRQETPQHNYHISKNMSLLQVHSVTELLIWHFTMPLNFKRQAMDLYIMTARVVYLNAFPEKLPHQWLKPGNLSAHTQFCSIPGIFTEDISLLIVVYYKISELMFLVKNCCLNIDRLVCGLYRYATIWFCSWRSCQYWFPENLHKEIQEFWIVSLHV